ncbi:Mce family protein [Nocardia beijingensis]|uniref:Mce family protein n=1 Tax=Nocardia beijingensis TaxID=95162 RepID=UPI0018948369|nr:Mce family protein [Nocardia beijingensis]MBF6076392.1 Mce family protein [Nocardia beijingensis]
MSRAAQFSVRGPGPAGLRLRGLALLAALAVLAVAVWHTTEPARADLAGFDLLMTGIGDGVGTHTPVRLRGMTIGSVEAIEPIGPDRQRVRVGVAAPRLSELSTTMQTRFVSANVFGSTALELVPMPGGAPIAAGGTLDLGDRVDNFTVTRILRDSGRAVADVLTSRMTTSLENAASLTDAVAPMLTSALLLARTWQRARPGPLADLLRQSADVAEGVGAFTPSALSILTALASVTELDDELRTRQASDTISEVSNLVFAFAGQLVGALGPTSQAVDMLLDLVVPLDRAMRGVTPGQLHDLATGIDGALHRRDDRVVLDVEVLIAAVPAFRFPVQAMGGAPR